MSQPWEQPPQPCARNSAQGQSQEMRAMVVLSVPSFSAPSSSVPRHADWRRPPLFFSPANTGHSGFPTPLRVISPTLGTWQRFWPGSGSCPGPQAPASLPRSLFSICFSFQFLFLVSSRFWVTPSSPHPDQPAAGWLPPCEKAPPSCLAATHKASPVCRPGVGCPSALPRCAPPPPREGAQPAGAALGAFFPGSLGLLHRSPVQA